MNHALFYSFLITELFLKDLALQPEYGVSLAVFKYSSGSEGRPAGV